MEHFLTQFADAINLPDRALQPGDELRDLPNWDSLAILMTISMMDIEYGKTVSGTDLQACATVDDVYRLTQENPPEAE